MCGIVGIQGSKNAALEVCQAMLLLQHRGQDAAGILSYESDQKQFHIYKDKGLVSQVFDAKRLEGLEGDMAIGHTRYATLAGKGVDGMRDLQPMLVNYPHGLGLVHNGNVVNLDELSEMLREKHHRLMLTKNDAEMLLNLISSQLVESKEDEPLAKLHSAAKKVFDEAQGGYAVVGIWANGHMFAMRDPHGIRPLIMGKKKTESGKDAFIFASESNVLSFLGYEIIRDLHPGELVTVNSQGELHSSLKEPIKPKSTCMFEWVYFATPETVMDGTAVYQARLDLGKKLGQKIKRLIDSGKMQADVVVPVPESGRIAAITLSEEVGLPYRELLIKNRYIQRSFILQDQESRKRAVQLKLMAVSSAIKGKRVLLVDDSIVRGTTSRKLIETVREAGAKEVYFVSTCPPITNPCYFGIDFPLKDELIAANREEKDMADYLKADGVIYQDIDGLKDALNQENLCTGCLTGKYPVDITAAASRFEIQRRNA
ncbi:MAG TPA: amidophosphoribosyltransferase [Bacteriovoracaceae bacterium]|nr:amidophosphoribosyltransferase [Bacteriovoracaceae bacterium]